MKQKQANPPAGRSQGAILLLTTILLFVLLGMVVSLSYVTVMEQKMSQKTKSSVGSFYNSESGVEWALNKIANSSGTIISAFSTFSGGKAPCPSGFGCDVYFLDKDGKVITGSSTLLSDIKAVRSVGSQGGDTQRAIEAAVAAPKSISYMYYCITDGGFSSVTCPIPDAAIGAQGPCDSGFTVSRGPDVLSICRLTSGSLTYFVPTGSVCVSGYQRYDYGKIYVCSK